MVSVAATEAMAASGRTRVRSCGVQFHRGDQLIAAIRSSAPAAAEWSTSSLSVSRLRPPRDLVHRLHPDPPQAPFAAAFKADQQRAGDG